MNVEERLLQAFEKADRFEPSSDLWSRVVHSIEEDQRHRARVVRTVATLAAALLAFAGGLAFVAEEGSDGWFLHWGPLEAIETFTLVFIIAVLGPAIGRFGRGYVDDLFAGDPGVPPALLRLLDFAYWLIGVGFILVSSRIGARSTDTLAFQLTETAERIGGLVFVLGVMHAVTLVLLPLFAFVHNSTQRGRPLPRWIVGLLGLLGLGFVTQVLPLLIGVLVIAGQGG
jgi:hypothetical protein